MKNEGVNVVEPVRRRKIFQNVDVGIKERLRLLNSPHSETVTAAAAADTPRAENADNPLLMFAIPYSAGIIYKTPRAACPPRSRDNLFGIWSGDYRKYNALINTATRFER